MDFAPFPVEQLGIGDLIVITEPRILSTVLGSCVAVCVFSTRGTVAAMNHFAMPLHEDAVADGVSIFRYGNQSLDEMVRRLRVLNSGHLKDLRAKVLGGAVAVGMRHSTRVGLENLALARSFLKEHGIPIVGEHVGGSRGRRVLFYTNTGRVRVRELEKEWEESP